VVADGDLVGVVTPKEAWGVNEALRTVLGPALIIAPSGMSPTL
jgi:hypothetical protein